MEIFEAYFNDFLYDLKSETLNSLLEENDEYNELYDEVDALLDSITTEYPELFEKIDELVSKLL